ncbi:valine--tRNA ligase [Candidatus Uhrbacteria bacterium RIFOXYC12_FULL_57_11]|nr:MAG: valine--tRNA ligase [Candidatus Uhrbacteria bacterium RIFOXYC12_FULL_57_11]
MERNDMPKAYDAKQYEDRIYSAWEESGFFNPDNLPGERSETFSMVLPPPNVTGTLHMGHAVMLAIEDIMVRFARMRGKKTLWVPGTDHAAIATSTKVEKILFKTEGKTRHDIGREAFLRRVETFAQDSHDTIVNQCKKMGASLDWSREAYTLDAKRNHAVNVAFKKMYDDGLIYRGNRVINWDPIGQTTISDIEIVYKEVEATLYTFRYAKDFPIAISTTRPETKVGDTAVAVHPDDERYSSFVGKTFENIPFAGTTITITVVADKEVDPAFGTGALGVTPAHSLVDADIAARHGLAMKQVIGADGRMTEDAGPLVAGQTTVNARETVASWLREQGLVEGEEKTAQNLATAERSGGTIEPIPMLQWFMAVRKEFERQGKTVTMCSLMRDAVESGKTKIIPERFEKTYFQWTDTLRDWNVSRQLWYGHRVPVWYRNDEIFVGTEAPEGDGWTQDPDTLDTWFSAGMWTFTTLGWPDLDSADLRTYHTTSVLETGYDILFFWVVRMMLMTTYLMDEVPFKTVYLHGLVRDEQGRKMSKSLDNIINPLDMIAKYGADATRLSLVIGSTPGNDTKLSEEKIAGYRNFTNKLWNISRFVLTSVESVGVPEVIVPKTLADRWILSRLDATLASVTKKLAAYEFSAAGEELRDFTWNDFADWYLEIAKIQDRAATDPILLHILEAVMRMWHPFMPFVTEQIWSSFKETTLMIEAWPVAGGMHDEAVEREFAVVQEAIVTIRNIRATQKVGPAKKVSVTVSEASLLAYAETIKWLARVEELTLGDKQGIQLVLGTMDVEAEHKRLTAERDQLYAYVTATEARLANAEFAAKAPEKVVAQMRSRRDEAAAKLAAIKAQLDEI